MNKEFYSDYHEYQKSKSLLGKIYQKFYLYPRLNFYIPQGKTILDVGSGLGDFLQTRPRNLSWGIEVNKHNVDFSKQCGLQVSGITPGDKYPFQDNSFDFVILDNVLEHIEDPRHDLKEIHRVLKPGGTVIIGVPGKKGFAHDADHKVYYDEASLTKLLATHHFVFDHGMYTPLPFLFLSEKISQFCFYGFYKKQEALRL